MQADAAGEPTRAQIEALDGPVMLEFGASWCGHCRAAQPKIREALEAHPGVVHIRIEDGPGRRLGRSYGVKLWPTLIFLHRGREFARLVRPDSAAHIGEVLQAICRAAP